MLRLTLGFVLLLSSLFAANLSPAANTASAQTNPLGNPNFGLPFTTDPGLDTWLMGGPYGNSTGGYARRREWYGAGQGIHFGIDFSARCRTPVASIGDGVVIKVDAREHGSAPHNLLIDHQNGYTSLYGHLFERPQVSVGQQVKKGEVVGLTGDPDLTCTSRPHLHLEIRDRTLRKAYNAHVLINADWDVLALSGSFGRGFQRDLDAPRKWQSLYDQPDISFGGPLINDFANTWPRDWQ